MGRIFTVVFNSDIATATTSVSEIFYYDWGQLPQGEYKVSFSFVSGIATLTNVYCANIFVDLGQDVSLATSNGKVIRSGYLGSLRYSSTGASSTLFASVNDNPPLYLMNRPSNNMVLIQVLSNSSTTGTDYSPVPASYTLCLSLELMD